MDTFKREGLPTLMPYLTVKDADGLLSFLKAVFAGEEIECYRGDNGTIMHASVRIGDAVVELGEASDRSGPTAAGLHVYVPNCDETYAKALAQGATSLQEVADMEYGERSGSAQDAFGNKWYIATTK